MKRIKIILPIVLVLALVILAVVLAHPSKSASALPRFVPLTTQPTGPLGSELYDWIDSIPFRDGKGWTWTVLGRSNHHVFLYDLKKEGVAGELFNAGPVFANQDQTKLLCEGPQSPYGSLRDGTIRLVNKITFGKINLATNANQIETFWILDLRNNSAVRIGEFAQHPGSGSRWSPAPGFRYGYNEPTTLQGDQDFFLCDLEAATLKRIHLPIHLHGGLRGWWDDHTIFAKDSDGNFVLYDVVAGQIRTVFTGQSIVQFLGENNLTNTPSGIKATLNSNNGGFDFYLKKDTVGITSIHNWNGSNYDFYFCADRRSGLDTNTTFLIKIERPGPTLKLLYRDFQLKWSGHLDATATHYLYNGYNGAPGKGGNGGVVLRDLVNHTEREIVPADNSGQYALARLIGDTVIYSRNRVLYRTDINGTNATRLFPSPGNGK